MKPAVRAHGILSDLVPSVFGSGRQRIACRGRSLVSAVCRAGGWVVEMTLPSIVKLTSPMTWSKPLALPLSTSKLGTSAQVPDSTSIEEMSQGWLSPWGGSLAISAPRSGVDCDLPRVSRSFPDNSRLSRFVPGYRLREFPVIGAIFCVDTEANYWIRMKIFISVEHATRFLREFPLGGGKFAGSTAHRARPPRACRRSGSLYPCRCGSSGSGRAARHRSGACRRGCRREPTAL